MGALDVFSTKKIAGTYTKPINLKAPVNTKQDDFSFSINTVTKKGYLSSNRDGGAGQDDIYAVQQLPPKKACAATVTGIVEESKFKQHLPFSKIIIKDNFGTTIKDIITDEEGRFSFKLPCNQQFVIIGSKEYYTSEVKSFKTSEKNLKVDLLLEIVADFGYNMDTELVIKTNPLYFNFNKWNISVDAEIELDYIVNIMTKYPKIILAGVSGTDARGSSFDNKILSQKRTKSVVNYLIDKGISSDRIYGKGDGESKLTNKCVDNDSHSNRVKCLEVEHQANRRTYFIVLNVEGKIINSEAKKLLPAIEIIKNSSNIKRL
jgi:outer membrane protein OmpA-like peptidoglycan-associated protein